MESRAGLSADFRLAFCLQLLLTFLMLLEKVRLVGLPP